MLKNIGSNWSLNAIQILVFLFLTPFVVGTLGEDLYGGWVTLVSLTGALQLLILGIPMASVRYVAEYVAKGDREGANKALSTCVGMTLFMGLIAVVVGVLLYFGLEQYLASDDWDLSSQQAQDARKAFVVVVINIAFGFVARLPYGVFDAHNDFVARNLIMGAGLLLRLALTVSLLEIDASLTMLAAVQVITMAAEFATALTVSRRRHQGIHFSLSSFDRGMLRDVLSFSVYSMLLNMGAMLAFRMDALVIGAFHGPERVTVYDLGNKVFEPFIGIVLAIGMVIMPAATSLKARNEEQELRVIFFKWTKVCVSLVVLIGGFLLVLGPEFLEAWLGEEYDPESGTLLQVLMCSFLIFLPARGVALPILMGLGKPGRPAAGMLLMGLVNLALSLLLIRKLGLLGVALGTALPNMAFAIFVALTACREIEVRPVTYFVRAISRPALGALIPISFLLVIKFGPGVSGLGQLFGCGVVFVLLFGIVWLSFVYKGDPDFDVLARLVARIRRKKEL